MGSYTDIDHVRDLTGYVASIAPSKTVNNSIQAAESVLINYIDEIPSYATGSKFWVKQVAGAFAAHFLCMRLSTQHAPGVSYAQGMKQNRGADWAGYATMAEHWWNVGIRILNMHGRGIQIKRVEP